MIDYVKIKPGIVLEIFPGHYYDTDIVTIEENDFDEKGRYLKGWVFCNGKKRHKYYVKDIFSISHYSTVMETSKNYIDTLKETEEQNIKEVFIYYLNKDISRDRFTVKEAMYLLPNGDTSTALTLVLTNGREVVIPLQHVKYFEIDKEGARKNVSINV